MCVDLRAFRGYTFQVTKDQGKRGGRGRKKGKEAPAKGSWGSLAAAIGAVAMLGVLLYGSFKAEDPTAAVSPEPAPAATTTPPAVTTAPAPTPPPAPGKSANGENWNDAQIAWQGYEAGMAKAKTENKPVCLVFYTSWCPHCRNYANVFQDPRIVARAKDFVMIRVNPDDESAIGDRYAPDGSYVPRTFFLAPDGAHMADVHAPRPKFQHFYDESDPASLLGGMDAALRKLARPM
ncbi:thioredoxin family protein [Polyangium sp. 6x1]|uniref:thioredoxin family protein n=1 Tax=Polyangium sp. 6x1 TaxID=3042689 RepID=UPI002482538C|nr:thioredoxin family protein [Polyangium sp. 6x1]MDI1443639.1 thioredoxin family protein [Polyangium sp. 6x1]